MTTHLPLFDNDVLEQVALTLADAATHAELPNRFSALEVAGRDAGSKWRRLLFGMQQHQARYRSGNGEAALMMALMKPVGRTP